MTITVPIQAAQILNILEQNGFEAYVVGGCVRDCMLSKEPDDWDICTSALPDQIKRCFAGYPVLDTGTQHGTVTVMMNQIPYEVTTFRVDGSYTDSRHPDSVRFVKTIRDDLARRDFTVNAMAYSPKRGLVDFFGGQEDLRSGVIRCVGNPAERFQEDALRILRALRFASTYCFRLDVSTARALHENKDLLLKIAAERIRAEFCKLLCGMDVARVLLQYADIIGVFVPEIKPAFGFRQNHPMHYLDVWEHTVQSVMSAPPDLTLRLTMLFHDLAKPMYCTSGPDGIDHFYGHAQKSADLAETILRRLRFDKETMIRVRTLVFYHGVELSADVGLVRRWLNRMGETGLRQLIEVKRADTMALAPQCREERLDGLAEIEKTIDRILTEQQCFSLKQLAINGNDLISLGIPEGKEIGGILNRLMDSVIEGKIPNEKDNLLAEAMELKEQIIYRP